MMARAFIIDYLRVEKSNYFYEFHILNNCKSLTIDVDAGDEEKLLDILLNLMIGFFLGL